MSIELMHTIAIVAYILAGVMLAVSVALYFLMDIRRAVGDISGSTARKAIENIRRQNEAGGAKTYKANKRNAALNITTDKIPQSAKRENWMQQSSEFIGTQKLDVTELEPQSAETTILNESSEADMPEPQSSETTILSPQELGNFADVNESRMKTEEENGNSFAANHAQNIPGKKNVFTVDVEMVFMGSDEIIQ